MSPPKPDAVNQAQSKPSPISPTLSADKATVPKKSIDTPTPKSATSSKPPSPPSGDKMVPKPTKVTASATAAAAGKDTPSTPRTGAAPRARKQKPAGSPTTGDSDSTGNNAPTSKRQKIAPAKQTPAAKKASAPKPASNTSAGVNTSTPARRRGRPPGSGGGSYARKPKADTANADGRTKAENSPPCDTTRRHGVARPKTTSNKPVEPWTVTPEGNRRFTTDDLSLLENGMFADAKIVCLKHEWKVHKTILCTRSKWFLDAFNPDNTDGHTCVVNLHTTEQDDVETLLRFIYSGSLDKAKFGIEKPGYHFLTYARIFNLGQTFELQNLSDDALSLLGQYCDQKLMEICSYDVSQSGRHGTVDQIRGSPDPYMGNLFSAIETAYKDVNRHTRLQDLFASFVWAGRDRLLRYDGFAAFADRCPKFGNDVFKLMLGKNTSQWLPSTQLVHDMCTGFDHSRKTQHPDRCEKCDEVFDEDGARKALYNPFKIAVRAGAWCAPCVDKHPGPAPLWRLPVVVAEPEED